MTQPRDTREKSGWAYCSTLSQSARCVCAPGVHERNLLTLLDGNYAESRKVIEEQAKTIAQTSSALSVAVSALERVKHMGGQTIYTNQTDWLCSMKNVASEALASLDALKEKP